MSTENLSSRACPECGGEGWYEADIGRGGSNPAECAACNGTGRDKRGEPLTQLTQLIRRYLKRKGRGYVANGIIPPSVVEDAEKLIYLMNLTATNDKVGKFDPDREQRPQGAPAATRPADMGSHISPCTWFRPGGSCDLERELRRTVRQAKRVLDDPARDGERAALASQVAMAEETLSWVDALRTDSAKGGGSDEPT